MRPDLEIEKCRKLLHTPHPDAFLSLSLSRTIIYSMPSPLLPLPLHPLCAPLFGDEQIEAECSASGCFQGGAETQRREAGELGHSRIPSSLSSYSRTRPYIRAHIPIRRLGTSNDTMIGSDSLERLDGQRGTFVAKRIG